VAVFSLKNWAFLEESETFSGKVVRHLLVLYGTTDNLYRRLLSV